MFNLIVSGGLENERRGSIMASRVFDYTSEEMEEKFKPGGVLDIPGVMSLPTILMEEGVGDQVAGVGWLNRIERKGTDYQLHFSLDPDVPRMTNAEISDLASELDIDDFEFHRNHWAIKDVDLFHVLYRKGAGKRSSPTVFQLSEKPVNPKLVSFMMPFSGPFTSVYHEVKARLEADGYKCQRADDMWVHAHIMSDIIELICTSAVVVCDLTGKNPNVFYEAGIAHALGKEVILITQSHDDVPFDLRPIRFIHYLTGC
ncbi:hypothetical protein [Pseudodonghicola xiamenensis]|uniref:Nucleoside 2-deoxyribosyltransferase n=1 Tax=Pseudodonghicola xiamenensis TaxID=337702 RepID=A0A8J3MF59_9RHOB|nr:hypothetical protein [Pseudodonghicola xiamenensis]GHH02116.1 hypothetical protein GCM10010961_39820 [Pseudodonghicola xiamenensis]